MRRFALGCFVVLSVAPFFAALTLEVAAGSGDLPASLLSRPPPHARSGPRVVARDGTVLRVGSRVVPLAEVSPLLVAALVAVEDARFFAHDGLDLYGLLRAARDSLRGRRGGGSTLSQQLAKLLEPRPRTLSAKWVELVRALRLERALGKAGILEQYLHRASFGPREIGVAAASHAYFGTTPAALDLPRAALLAGLPQSPVRFDPRRAPARALARRAHVLRRMESRGMISAEARAHADAAPLGLSPPQPPPRAEHLVARALAEAPHGAPWVTTTLDASLQREVQRVVSAHLRSLRERGASDAAVVVLENESGDVLAYAAGETGGVDFGASPRQPGSTLKPFAYGLALERGATAATLVDDVPLRVDTPRGRWMPFNADLLWHGRVRLREALASSYNVAAVRVASWVGAAAFHERLRALGFAHLEREVAHYGLGLVLGNGEVTPLELAAAYATLARGGVPVAPGFVLGRVGEGASRLLPAEESFVVASMLSDDSSRAGLGDASVLALPFAAAAKTGTSTAFRDAWVAGFTTEVTVVVWVGDAAGAPMKEATGLDAAAPLWREVMLAAMDARPRRNFTRPAGVVPLRLCKESGARAVRGCASTHDEVFRAGSAPESRCHLHGARDAEAENDAGQAALALPEDALAALRGGGTVAARLARVAAALDGRYAESPLGEGPDAELDRDPLARFDVFDCQTFVETALAFALTPARAAGRPVARAFLERLRALRYRDGIVSFDTRHHFPVADWLPGNAHVLRDVTGELGAVSRASARVDRRGWYARLRAGALRRPDLGEVARARVLESVRASGFALAKTEVSLDYLPSAEVRALPEGAIVAFVHEPSRHAASLGTELLVRHLGIVVRGGNEALVRHASPRFAHVTTERLAALLRPPGPAPLGIVVLLPR